MRPLAPPPGIPTGFPALDALLPAGIPRGRLSEIAGGPTSGARSLALSLIRQAQERGDLACLLDLGTTFAGDDVWHFGIDPDALLIARPPDALPATRLIAALLTRRAVGLIVVDGLPHLLALPGGGTALGTLLRRLPHLLADSSRAVVVLNPSPLPFASLGERAAAAGLTHLAALRLCLQHAGWLRAGDLLCGRQVKVEVLRPPLCEPGPSIVLSLPYPIHEEAL